MNLRKKRFDELSPYKIIHHDIKRRYPIHVEIDPTSACQQNCLRCSYKQNIDGRRDYIIHRTGTSLPYERFEELIDEFKSIGMRAITLSGGGEPLVYPKIENIISRVYSANLKLGIITNLSVNTDLKLLSRAVWIRVSLDAATRATYNLLHRPANKKGFDLVLDNIQGLSSYASGLDLGINFLIQPENHMEVLAAARLAKGLGAKYIRFAPAIATETIDYEDIFSRLGPIFPKCLELIDDHFHVFISKERVNSLTNKEKSYVFCHKQQIHPLIGADGNVYPCCLLKYYAQHDLGNILEHSFASVWEGARRKAWLEKLDVDQCPPCWFDETNEFIEYMLRQNPKHVDFV